MDICTKCHGNPSDSYLDISLKKNRSVNPDLVLEWESGSSGSVG